MRVRLQSLVDKLGTGRRTFLLVTNVTSSGASSLSLPLSSESSWATCGISCSSSSSCATATLRLLRVPTMVSGTWQTDWNEKLI